MQVLRSLRILSVLATVAHSDIITIIILISSPFYGPSIAITRRYKLIEYSFKHHCNAAIVTFF